jgi:DNA uptake protein ComE-like DNA-binding protein
MRRLTQFGLTNQDVTNIMNYRNRNRSFKYSGELLNVSGMNYTKFGKVADYITMNDREKEVGLVNINTAPRTVLIALFEGSEEKSQKVLDYRNGTDAAYKDMGTLAKSLGNSAFIPISDKVTLRSSQFTIQSLGRLSDKKAYTRLLVVVDRALVPIKTLYFRDISYMGAGI